MQLSSLSESLCRCAVNFYSLKICEPRTSYLWHHLGLATQAPWPDERHSLNGFKNTWTALFNLIAILSYGPKRELNCFFALALSLVDRHGRLIASVVAVCPARLIMKGCIDIDNACYPSHFKVTHHTSFIPLPWLIQNPQQAQVIVCCITTVHTYRLRTCSKIDCIYRRTSPFCCSRGQWGSSAWDLWGGQVWH